MIKPIQLQKVNTILQFIIDTDRESSSLSLYDGKSSEILLLAYLKRFYSTTIYDNRLVKLIGEAYTISRTLSNYTYGVGIPGFYWLLKHLNSELNFSIDYDDTEYKRLTLLCCEKQIQEKRSDFIYGLDGLLFSLLETESLDIETLTQFMVALDELATQDDSVCYWLDSKSPQLISGPTRVDLGLAHGLCSRIILLATIIKKFPEQKIACRLIHKCIKFLLQHEQPSNEISLFPAFTAFTDQFSPSRLSWCYGDLGVASALSIAGKVLNNKFYIKKSIEIMLNAARHRDLNKCRVVDACLCHGSAGVAHIFNRYYLENGLVEFRTASLFWLEKTIDYVLNEESPSIKTWNPINKTWEIKHGLLGGDVGVGLALLGFLALDKKNLTWDRSILLS